MEPLKRPGGRKMGGGEKYFLSFAKHLCSAEKHCVLYYKGRFEKKAKDRYITRYRIRSCFYGPLNISCLPCWNGASRSVLPSLRFFLWN